MKIALTTLVTFITIATAGCGPMQASNPDGDPAGESAISQQAEAAAADGAAIRERLMKSLQKVDAVDAVVAMRPSIRDGWHEVHYLDVNGRDQFGYASNDGETLFLGEMIDMEAGVSVSLLSALQVRDLLLQEEAGSGRAINWPAQKPTQTLYAFTDPTCKDCADLHAAIPELNAAGITVTYLALPGGEKGDESFDAAAAAWCRPDRAEGFALAMTGGLAGASASADCEATIMHHQSLAYRLGVSSAPMLVSSQGVHIEGFPGTAALVAQLTPPPAAPRTAQAASQGAKDGGGER